MADLSHNGWPVVRSEATWPLPAVTGNVLAHAVWVVFNWLAGQYAARVEPINRSASWGYAYRRISGSSSWSNHASATAVDFNAPQHPMGSRGTMTSDQAEECRAIEAESGGILNWGDAIPDEMHWEIAKGTSAATVAAFATRLLQAALGVTVDGVRGDNTLNALRAFQTAHGLDADGIDGPKTWAVLTGNQPAPAPKPDPAPAPAHPAFPLPSGAYFGPKSGPAKSVSGYYSHRDELRSWQQRMRDRGWTITPDGLYGPDTKRVATGFQKEKGLQVDGLIGVRTWDAAWTEPIKL